MAAEGSGGLGDGVGGGGNETPSISPKSRVKLLCSYGGKILPRPTDGVLKYVGGETRVVAFSRGSSFSGDISFSLFHSQRCVLIAKLHFGAN